jgi:hypothetical protein
MRRTLALATGTAFLLLAPAALPDTGPSAATLHPLAPHTAHAQATKSRGTGATNSSGSTNVRGAGDRLGDLLAGWAVPVLTVIAGCLLIAALASRNIGAAAGIVAVTLLGLIFLLAPESIESLAKGIADVVF